MEDELKEIKNSLEKLPEEEKNRVLRDIKRLISIRGKKKRPFGAIGFAPDTNTTPATQPLPSPLTPNEADRLDVIRTAKDGITARELAERMDSNRNTESLYLNKIRDKGYLGQMKGLREDGREAVYLLLEEAVRKQIEKMKKLGREDISPDDTSEIASRINSPNIRGVREIIERMEAESEAID